MRATRLRINAPSVVGEVIDGEAVILNLETGKYYSARGSGSAIWSWLEGGASRDELVARAQHTFDAPGPLVADGVTRFVDDLAQHGLVVADDAAHDAAAAHAPAGEAARLAFATPLLEEFDDMRDILLLDPIHDVDDEGWPRAKPGG